MQLIAHHNMTPAEIDWIEDRLYEHNAAATGRSDGEGMGFEIRDEAGEICAITAGHTWAGVSEIKQMWVRGDCRGRGYGAALLKAMVDEAARRGVKRIWVSSYSFQAPGLYEKAGFVRHTEVEGWPDGHVNVLLCKTLGDA